MAMYALEHRHRRYVLAFDRRMRTSSAYRFLWSLAVRCGRSSLTTIALRRYSAVPQGNSAT
jgi:hypothetical protein